MRTSLGPTLALVLALVLALTGAGCVSASPPATTFASEPSGARVLVDGRDSGFVTPCLIDLGTDEPRAVTLVLDGFEKREIQLDPHRRTRFIAWRQGTMGLGSNITFPILLPWV